MASSLTIAPALGRSLVTAQGMAGGYDAIDDRSFWQIGLQEGAVGSGDFMVTERGAGANMTVDVACNTGFVVVQGDTVSNQGLYLVRPHTAVANLDIAAAHATNPRVDSVVVQVDDDEHDAGGNTRARVMVLSGTDTGGATLDNRTGAPALPSSAMLLADVLVPATDTTISNSQIRDRRKWARGAFVSGAIGGSDAWGTGTLTLVSDTQKRLECSGASVRVIVRVRAHTNTNATADRVQLALYMDSAAVTNAETFTNVASGAAEGVTWSVITTPAAGSHLFEIRRARNGSGNYTDTGFQVAYEEIVRQNVANNSTTSG